MNYDEIINYYGILLFIGFTQLKTYIAKIYKIRSQCCEKLKIKEVYSCH